MMLTFGELFAGVGGFSSGFIRAGFQLKWCCEWDKNCQHILRRHNPGVPIYGDITTLDPSVLEYVDVISYSFPCQDLSVAGKRKGMVDDGKLTRSGLFYEAIRIIHGVKPRLAIFENVPGLLNADRGNAFGNALRELARIGYGNTVWTTLDSQFFSVAQRRRRVFGISSREVEPNIAKECLQQIYTKPESVCGDIATCGEAREEAAGDAGESVAFGGSGMSSYKKTELATTLRVEQAKQTDVDLLVERERERERAITMPTYIPETCGAITDGAHNGGGLNGQDAYTGRVIVTPK